MEKYTYHDVNMRGSIQVITYQTKNRDNEVREKYANVYLPYGYHEADNQTCYNIIYLMHGGGGNPDAWLDCSKVKNMLDYSISTNRFEPLIVVFPSYYKEKIGRIGAPNKDLERDHVLFFQKELVEDLLPAVEGVFPTYTRDRTQEAFRASRGHRAFGGFSMGAATTWFALTTHLDYFSKYIPLSGDSWEVEAQGGLTQPEETAKILHDAVIQSGYEPDEYAIYVATGSEDIAYQALTNQMKAMELYLDTFIFSADLSKGNCHYLVAEGEDHSYDAVYSYLYTILPYVFA